MAEHAPGGSNKRYYSTFQGTFRRRVNEPGENTETRVNKNDKTVHEIIVGAVSGYFRSFEAEKGDYGVQLKYGFEDEGGHFEVQLPITSDYARDLNNRLMNIAPKTLGEHQVKIDIFDYNREDGKKSGFCIPYVDNGTGWENAVKIDRKFTKESPGDMPPWEKALDPKTGEEVWSQLKQNNFLAQGVKAIVDAAKQFQVNATFAGSPAPIPPKPAPAAQPPVASATGRVDLSMLGDDDDLPF